MPRARNIKFQFFTNDVLAECSHAARLLFIGLWCCADREGRIEDRPKRIKGEVFRFGSEDIDALLDELIQREFVVRYEVNGCKCLWIPTFHKHQKPHHREAPSTIPAPPRRGKGTDKARPRPDLGSGAPALNEECGMMNDECGYDGDLALGEIPETKSKSAKFKRPTFEQVEAYCMERNNGVDARKWLNHYEAKGWLIGKAPMKDWQAAVRTWENREAPAASRLPTPEELANWNPVDGGLGIQ